MNHPSEGKRETRKSKVKLFLQASSSSSKKVFQLCMRISREGKFKQKENNPSAGLEPWECEATLLNLCEYKWRWSHNNKSAKATAARKRFSYLLNRFLGVATFKQPKHIESAFRATAHVGLGLGGDESPSKRPNLPSRICNPLRLALQTLRFCNPRHIINQPNRSLTTQ